MRSPFNILGFILALTAVVFAQTLTFDFAGFDDRLLITENLTAQGLSIENIGTAFSTYDPELYVPITLLSYQIEHSIAGLSPWIYHLTNLLIHLGCTALVFLIFRRLSKHTVSEDDSYYVAGFIALLFALHPLNVQTVAWAAARKDNLSTLFLLLSFFFFLKDTRPTYRLSILCFALGLAAKVSIVLAPVIFLLTYLLEGKAIKKKHLITLIPYCVLSGIFGLVALGGKQQQLASLSLFDNILLSAKSAFFYIQNLFTPSGLALFYHHTGEISLLRPTFFVPMIIVVLMIALAMISYKKKPFITFGIAFFFLLLLPSFFNFWKNGFIDIASDRYAYLALSGLTFCIGTVLIPHLRHKNIAGVLVALALAASSFAQARIWTDGETLLRATLRSYPNSTHALINLGTTLYEQGKPEAAVALYDQAIEIDPMLSPALLNKARVVSQIGSTAEALELTERAVKVIPTDRTITPDELQAFFFLGILHEEMGALDKAFLAFTDATVYAPESAMAFFNLGVMFQKYSRPAEARDAFVAAYKLDSKGLENRYRLAAVEAELGNIVSAILHLEYIVKKAPQYQQAAKHLEALKSVR